MVEVVIVRNRLVLGDCALSASPLTTPLVPTSPLTLNLASVNVVGDVLGAPAVDLAAGGESSAQDLLDRTLQVLGHGLEAHLACDLNNLVKRDRLCVLDVLLLLAVTRGLLQGLDDQGAGRGNDGDGGLTVLDRQANGDTETFLNDNQRVRAVYGML